MLDGVHVTAAPPAHRSDEALQVEAITEYRSASIVGLETSITDPLAAVFDQNTPKFYRYRAAADLEPAPNLRISRVAVCDIAQQIVVLAEGVHRLQTVSSAARSPT